jgi:hypothetical protein
MFNAGPNVIIVAGPNGAGKPRRQPISWTTLDRQRRFASGHRGPGAGFMEQCEQGVEMNPETPEKDIDRVFREGTALDEAMTRAYRRAVRQHRQNGVPMVFWENGKIVEVPADQLPDFSVD